MAFDASEKVKIRKYLGVSGTGQGVGVMRIKLDGAINVIGDLEEESTYAREILEKLDNLDTNIAEAGVSATSSATTGALKKADEVEWFEPRVGQTTQAAALTGVAYGDVLINQLATLFGVADDLAECDLPRYFHPGRRGGGRLFSLG